MKLILISFIICICSCFCNSIAKLEKIAKVNNSHTRDTAGFKLQVQPVLQNNCSPCHFPGGKLYEKLPFDKGSTIISHKAGVLKRFKKEEDLKLLRQYTAQNK